MPDETIINPEVGERLAVLIVEDESLIAMDLEMMLEQVGHAVFAAVASVEAALKVLETAQPDVAVLDLNLRGQLVSPVAERLRGLKIPFVVASAYTDLKISGSEAVVDAENVGKPIDKRHLYEALRRAVAPA